MEKDVVQKNKGKRIAIILVIVLILVLGLGYLLFFNQNKPDRYLTKLSTKTSSYITNAFDTFSNIKTNKELKNTKQTGTLMFDSNLESLSFLKDYTISYDSLTSLEDEKIRINLNLLESDKSLLKETFYVAGDSIYLNYENLYEKPIRLLKLSMNIFPSLKELEKETYTVGDIKIILESFIKYFFEALKESDMKSENISIEEIKYTYEFNEQNISKIEEKFKELCKQDSKLQNIIKSSNFDFKINAKNVKIEFIINRFNKKVQSIVITKDDNKTEIIKQKKGEYLINNEDKLTLADDKFTYEDYDNQELICTFSYTNQKDNYSVKIKDKDISTEININKVSEDNIQVSIISEKSQEEKKFDIKINVKIKDDASNESEIIANIVNGENKFSIKGNIMRSYTDDEVSELDVSKSVDIKDLTEDEINDIIKNILKSLLESNFDKILDNANF